jgi:hypothetical protein
MTRVTTHHGPLGVAVVLMTAPMAPLSAQLLRVNTANADLPSFGAILNSSSLLAGVREPTGNLYLSGTVTFRQNGPWALQVKLTTPFVDKNGNGTVKATNEVRVLLANNSYSTVGTSAWVTIATGPGTNSTVKPVKYYIVWGKSSSKGPALALEIPVTYQVIPL